MHKSLDYYCRKFAKLQVSRSKGIAPHKPILLLSAIELISQGYVRRNQIPLSPELIATFLKLWSQLGSASHHADIGLPFFHLRSEGFWHHKAKSGFEAVVGSSVKIRTLSAIRESIQYAYFDDELFELLQHPASRRDLVDVLVTAWFSEKTQQIEALLQVDALQEFQERLRTGGGCVYQPQDLADEEQAIVRDAAFRRVIVSVYEHRCAFCGLQIISSLNQNIVDGAHIKPFSQFYDDRLDNGLSLCKNHHWAFDRGWFAIADDYSILVSSGLKEDSPNGKPMSAFKQESIWLPPQSQYLPRLEAIRWHRDNVFNCA